MESPARRVTPLWTPQNGVGVASEVQVFLTLDRGLDIESIHSLFIRGNYRLEDQFFASKYLKGGVKEGRSPSYYIFSFPYGERD